MFDINSVVAGTVVLTAFALALDGIVSLVERRLMVWQPRNRDTERLQPVASRGPLKIFSEVC